MPPSHGVQDTSHRDRTRRCHTHSSQAVLRQRVTRLPEAGVLRPTLARRNIGAPQSIWDQFHAEPFFCYLGEGEPVLWSFSFLDGKKATEATWVHAVSDLSIVLPDVVVALSTAVRSCLLELLCPCCALCWDLLDLQPFCPSHIQAQCVASLLLCILMPVAVILLRDPCTVHAPATMYVRS